MADKAFVPRPFAACSRWRGLGLAGIGRPGDERGKRGSTMNIAALLAKTARSLPERPAVSLGDEVTADYGTLHERAGAIAGALRSVHGLNPARGWPSSWRTGRTTWKRCSASGTQGLVAVPVNAKLHPREVAYILGNSGTRLCIADEGHAEGIESVRGRGAGPCRRRWWRARTTGAPCSATTRKAPPQPGPTTPPGSSTPAAPRAGPRAPPSLTAT